MADNDDAGGIIATYPTDTIPEARSATSIEPEASLRAELTAQVNGAQQALEAQIDALRHAANMGGDTAALALAQNQLAHLTGLGRRIDHATGGSLASMRAEVMAFVAATQAASQQARTAAATAQPAEMALHAAQAEARHVTGDFVHDFYERRIFDPYLTFASVEEERAYREREEARQRAIAEARALGTPEGDLLALRLSEDQLRDAARYGADQSPDFAPTLESVTGARQSLEQAMGVSGLQAQQDHENAAAGQAALVSPEIIASLRSAGVSVPPADASAPIIADNRIAEAGRTFT